LVAFFLTGLKSKLSLNSNSLPVVGELKIGIVPYVGYESTENNPAPEEE